MRESVVVIVEPFSSGKRLASEFVRHGWRPVAVVNRVEVPAFAGSLRSGDFERVVVHDDDVAATAHALGGLPVAAVVPGTESGVVLADALAAVFGVAGNDPATSAARRDKDAMSAALHAAGVPAPMSATVTTVEDALEWAEQRGSWPVVLKPRDGAGNSGVHVCHSPAEIKDAWSETIGVVNALGFRNDDLLIQDFLAGPQYVVNTVSVAGEHRVHAVLRDYRIEVIGGRNVYDYLETLPPQAPEIPLLVGYIRTVLDALGVRQGAGHSELIITERGPVLVETAARLMGLDMAPAELRATGTSQLAMLTESVIDPIGFRAAAAEPHPYRHSYKALSLIAPYSATVDSAELSRLLNLPTVANVVLHLDDTLRVGRTVDLDKSPGTLHLVGSPAAVAADAAAIRASEESALYVR